MAKLKRLYILELSQEDVIALHKILGGLTDPELSKLGVSGESREKIRDIWNLISSIDEDE